MLTQKDKRLEERTVEPLDIISLAIAHEISRVYTKLPGFDKFRDSFVKSMIELDIDIFLEENSKSTLTTASYGFILGYALAQMRFAPESGYGDTE